MTLIELMVVVVSIGILALIAVPRFAGSTEQAFDAVMAADLRNLANAQEAYVSEFKTVGGPTSAGTILNDNGELRWRPVAGVRVDAPGTTITATFWRVQLARTGTTPACTATGDDGSAAASAASASAATDNTACTR